MATRPVVPEPTPVAAGRADVPVVRLVVRSWREFEDAGQCARWDALASWAAEPNPFHEAWYLLPALQAFDPAGRVRLLCLEADGVLAGILPIASDWTYYGYPLPQMFGWTHPNCFLGVPLVASGFEWTFWRAVLGWADGNAGKALFLHLAQIALEGPLHAALREVCASGGRQLEVVQRESRALLRSDLAPEAYYAAALGGKKRKELRRQRNRLSELGKLEVRRCEDGAGLEAWIDDFLVLEARGWKGANGSALACAGRTSVLFREALRGAAARGRLERLDLVLDGKPVAMLANFLTAPGAFSFKTTFDEAFSRYSPGVLLQRENLALLERPGIDWCDSCAEAEHPMIDHLWRDRREIGRVSVAIGGAARRRLFAALARRETRGSSK